MSSPYDGLSVDVWRDKTLELISQHPLMTDELYEVVVKVWEDIFRSEIGSSPFKIGEDIFRVPQIMGFFLHELVPLELEFRYPEI